MKIGLNLYGTNTLNTKAYVNVQGDEKVALSWKKYLERVGVERVDIYKQSQGFATDLDVVIHFNPFFPPHSSAQNILYLQNAFPHASYEGGTIGVFNREKVKFSGFIFTSTKLMHACAPGIVLPFATDPEEFYPQTDNKFKIPVSMVGNDIRGREVNLKYIAPAIPYGLCIFGRTAWTNELHSAWKGEISQEDLPKLYSSCAINLNAHIDEHLKCGTINLRIFDAAACAGFVISDYMDELKEVFGDTIVYNDGFNDLDEKIRVWLENEDERNKKAKEAQAIVLNEHTYKIRIEILMRYLKNI